MEGANPGKGAVVADEPRAALVGREILLADGTAADAAVAMYFAMSVTYPASAGLGGGGVCMARRPPAARGEKPLAEALEFIGPATSAGSLGLGAAVPGNVRGMYALHARYGRLRWSRVLRPAEALARQGVHVSRALAKELALGADSLPDDARRLFRIRDGAPPGEGDWLVQPDLADVLGRLRMRGPLDFYNGDLARALSAGAAAVGVSLSAADLRAFTPRWHVPIRLDAGGVSIYLPPVGGGKVAAALWKSLYEDGDYRRAAANRRARVVADAIAQSLRKTGANAGGDALPDPAVASFAAMDGRGGAVACAVTLNGRFGSGRLIRGAGFFAAAPPGSPADGRWALSPVVVASGNTPTAMAAAVPSGNAAAPSALVWVALRLFQDEAALGTALSAARVFPASSNAVYVEHRNGSRPVNDAVAGLRQRPVAALGRVNVIYCPEGVPSRDIKCVFRADPRGYGYAADAVPAGGP